MCLGCLDDDEPPATRREFLATALQLTAASALGATAALPMRPLKCGTSRAAGSPSITRERCCRRTSPFRWAQTIARPS